MANLHEIVILGATPAGFAAATYLAAHKADVVLLDAPLQPVECPLCEWAPRDVFQIAGLPTTLAKSAHATGFHRVCYHNASLEKHVEHNLRGTAGYFLHAGDLTRALRAAAVKAGAKIRTTTTSPAVSLKEDHVELIGSVRVAAKLLLITLNRPNDVLSDLSLPMRTVPHSSLVVAGLDVPLSGRPDPRLRDALHVVESPERSELGLFFVAGTTLHLRVISSSTAAGTRAEELSDMMRGLQRAGLLPATLHLGRARGAVWSPPAGVALELETHVAKRCLLAGTAGGFAESITGQTLAPSLKSAMLAGAAALAALKSPDVQDALMGFKSSWRKSLADCLRPPSTSLQLLLPLLFVNQKIVAKFTQALLFGESV